MKKILVVDDEPMMLKLVDRALNKHYETILTSSGAKAVELFMEDMPDLVLSDLKMPAMSGYELQSIIQEKSDDRIPFIFMTADESDDSESRGFEQGAADYIRKPIKSKLLLQRVQRILEAQDENAKLREAAQTDAMTGIYNKAAVESILTERCWKVPGMLIIVDLDNFKQVNDTFGHAMGDKILVSFSGLLKSSFRESDIVGRIGGDEFIVYCEGLFLPSVVERKADDFNEKLKKTARELMGENLDFSLGCSVGACASGPMGEVFPTLFARADKAMYNVKEDGKHGCFVDMGLLEESGSDIDIEALTARSSGRGRGNGGSGFMPTGNDAEKEIRRKEKEKLPEWLLNEPSLDINVGLDNSETAEVYLSSIEIYLAHSTENASMLEIFCREEDIENYTIKIHALKSTSRVIGALYLAEKAAALERAGLKKNLDYIRHESPRFLVDYRALTERFSRYMTIEDRKPLSEEEREDMRMVLREYAQAEDFSLMESLFECLDKYILTERDAEEIARIKSELYKLEWDNIRTILED